MINPQRDKGLLRSDICKSYIFEQHETIDLDKVEEWAIIYSEDERNIHYATESKQDHVIFLFLS